MLYDLQAELFMKGAACECVNDGPFLDDLVSVFGLPKSGKVMAKCGHKVSQTEWLAKRLAEHAESLALVSLSNITVK